MRKHRTLLLATACLALAIIFGVLMAPNDEPRYNGHLLSKWLQVYSENAMTQESPQFSEAEQAISQHRH